MTNYSRLQSRQNKFTEQQILIFIVASIVLVVAIGYFGISFLFSLTTKISEYQRKNVSSNAQNGYRLAPNAPTLSQEYLATSSANVKISGVAAPKTNVELFQNERPVGSILSSDQGNFSFDVTLEKGTNVFSAQAISDKGTRSNMSTNYSVNFITGTPKLDVSTPTDKDEIRDSPIVITGVTDPGNSISVNDHVIVVSDSGNFSYYLNLNEGDNKIVIVATDVAGNQTKKEMTVKLSR